MRLSWLWPFNTTSAGRRLSQHRARQQRELVKATARQMREDMGLPPLRALK
jgi:hypothetical protein